MKTIRAAILAAASIALACGMTPASAETRTLKVMGYQSTFVQYREGWAYAIKKFEELHPDVKIEDIATAFDQTLNQVTLATMGGNPPDVVVLNPIWMPQLVKLGALEPLENRIPADEMAQFPKRIMEDLTFEGHAYGVALNPGLIMMIYNRDLMKEAGLDPDQPPKTWDEFTKAVKAVCALPARADGKVYGVTLRTERQPIAAQWTIPIIWANGGDFTDKDGNLTLNTPAAVAAFKWYQETVRSGCAPENATVADTRNLFSKGRSGFIFEGPWMAGLVKALSNDTLKIGKDKDIWLAPMPADDSGRIRQFANHGVMSVMSGSKEKDLATEFIRFVIGNRDVVEYAFKTSGVINTSRYDLLRSGTEGADPFSQVFVDGFETGIALPIKNANWAAAMDPIAVALQQAIQGQDPGAVLSVAERAARRILAK